jgi:serine/threonine protein kinase
MALAPGTRLGQYEVRCSLGAGGMGEVYRAHDLRLERDVALKVLPDVFANDLERMARFEREAKVLAALNHPNVAAIYGIEGRALVMELVEGEMLSGPLPLETAVHYAQQIADALEAAHEKGIIHRDLKPANIKVTAQGIVKVLDFGLAAVTQPSRGDPATSPTLTVSPSRAGMILGTAAYMSPEQARGKPVDKRADIWAFGVVLYEMLTGRALFGGETVSDTLAAVLKTDPDWGALPPGTPASVRRLLRRCLERDCKNRLRDIGDAFADLDERQDRADPPLAVPPKPQRHWWIAIAAALALVAVGWAVALFRGTLSRDNSALRLHIDPPEGGQFVFGTGLRPGGFAISPDGRTLAYIAVGNGKVGLWIHPLDSGTPRLVPGTEDVSYPFWSPDSRFLAFIAGQKLERVDRAGGPAIKICDLETGVMGGAWGRDGSILIGTRDTGLLRVPAAGGSAATFTKQPAANPRILPGGRFLYTSVGSKPGETGVFAASLANPSKPVQLLSTDTNALYAPGSDGKSYLLFVRGTTLFAQQLDPSGLRLSREPHPLGDPVASMLFTGRMNVDVSNNGLLVYGAPSASSRLQWVDRSGRRLAAVGEPGQSNAFRLSPDGLRAAMVRTDSDGGSIWLVDTTRAVATRFLAHPSLVAYPVWSPDGETIAFSTTLGPVLTLFRKRLSGRGTEERLTESPATFHLATDWSRDGRFLLFFDLGRASMEDIWYLRVPPEGSLAEPAALKPYLRTTAREFNGRFSPETDPRAGPLWVAYQSDESGRSEIYIDSFPEPRRKILVSTNGGWFPEWGRALGNGEREMYYVSPDYKLMMVTLRRKADWLEPSTEPQELFSLPAEVTTWSPYQVAADGQRFLVRATAEREPPRPLTVIVNWPALLQDKGGGQR